MSVLQNENLVGTEKGVIKCRTVRRMPEEQRWNKELVPNMKGSPWEPVPGVRGEHVLVETNEDLVQTDLVSFLFTKREARLPSDSLMSPTQRSVVFGSECQLWRHCQRRLGRQVRR